MTPPEIGLWLGLRGGQIDGLHFRRQHPIGPYVLDFFCRQICLAVEVDGGGHSFGDQPERDARRDAWLAERGIHTLRLSASYVLGSTTDALETVRHRAKELRGLAVADSLPADPLRPVGPPPPAGED